MKKELETTTNVKNREIEKAYSVVPKTTFKNNVLKNAVEKEKSICRKKTERIK